MNWIEELKVGDPVIYGWSQYGNSSYRKKLVTKVTPTRVEVDNTIFTKKDGKQYGAGMYAPHVTIEPYDPAHPKMLKTLEDDRRGALIHIIRNSDLWKATTDELQIASDAIKAYVKVTK